MQPALGEHGAKLADLVAKAEQLEDALAGGQSLRKVVAASRTLRQDLADSQTDFQATRREIEAAHTRAATGCDGEQLGLNAVLCSLEQTCERLERGWDNFDDGVPGLPGCARIASLEFSCIALERAMLRLRGAEDAMRRRMQDSQQKIEEQALHIKRLQENLVNFHRKKIRMAEEIRTLDDTRKAMETERRRLESNRERTQCHESARLQEELAQAQTLLENTAHSSDQEIKRLRALVQEQDMKLSQFMIEQANKVLARWTHRASGACLDAWREHTAEEGRRRAVIGRVARRMQQHGMALAWSTWEGRVEEAVAERQNEEWRQHTMAKVVRRIRNQGLVSAFGRWSGNVAEACRKRRVMRKVLLQLYNRRLSGAFERWLDSVRELKAAAEEEARLRVVQTKVVKRMMNRLIDACWAHWCQLVEEGLAEREEQERRQHIVSKSVKRILHGTISAAWTRWVENVAELKAMAAGNDRLRTVRANMVYFLRGARFLLGVPFTRWFLYVANCLHARQSARKGMDHWRRFQQLRSFITWSSFSMVKQIGLEDTMTVSYVGYESPSALTRRHLSLSPSKSPSSSYGRAQEQEIGYLHHALLSSYQRLESERLRRRAVLRWATAVRPMR